MGETYAVGTSFEAVAQPAMIAGISKADVSFFIVEIPVCEWLEPIAYRSGGYHFAINDRK